MKASLGAWGLAWGLSGRPDCWWGAWCRGGGGRGSEEPWAAALRIGPLPASVPTCYVTLDTSGLSLGSMSGLPDLVSSSTLASSTCSTDHIMPRMAHLTPGRNQIFTWPHTLRDRPPVPSWPLSTSLLCATRSTSAHWPCCFLRLTPIYLRDSPQSLLSSLQCQFLNNAPPHDHHIEHCIHPSACQFPKLTFFPHLLMAF